MAITAWPFETQDSTENQYSQLFREFQDSGICDSADGTGLKVQPASGMSVNILPGAAILRGFIMDSDATETRAITAPSASARKDRVILRLDPTANTITPVVLAGTPGTGVPPALTQSMTNIFEISLAIVSVAPGDVGVSAGAIVDDRPFVGTRVGAWTTTTRPANPRKSRLGFNVDAGAYEFWSGTAWVSLLPSTVDNAIKWNGYRIVVSATTPGGNPDADRIWIQPTP